MFPPFAPVEFSQTMVGFIFYTQWKEELDGFLNARDQVKRFLETGTELPPLFQANGVVGKCYPFSRICDEQSADILVPELVQMAQANGFPIKPLTKCG